MLNTPRALDLVLVRRLFWRSSQLQPLVAFTGYRPSQALIDAFGTLQQPEPLAPSARPSARSPRELKGGKSSISPPPSSFVHSCRPSGVSLALQTVPSTKSKYKPSTELEAEINALLRGKAASSPSGSDARRAFGTRGMFFCPKCEYVRVRLTNRHYSNLSSRGQKRARG